MNNYTFKIRAYDTIKIIMLLAACYRAAFPNSQLAPLIDLAIAAIECAIETRKAYWFLRGRRPAS